MNPDIESILEQFVTEEKIEAISDLKVLNAEEDLGIYSLQFKSDNKTYRIKAIKENIISWNIIRLR